jgi:transcription termination factor NusB
MKDVIKLAYDEIDEFIGKSIKKASEAIEKLTKVILCFVRVGMYELLEVEPQGYG